ncbi:hypothetical protein UFOVP1229_77 [uncultured Caudovirales phage]|uniref:Uncharacterized protein n=1 Tax=uncultured Caudovirales phage TaxID=2100421 RepID=A0A6J5R768_9CAUD|nr:hypothetical protein UFOVP1229_77 [uncultured Caudovirales phage]
MTDQYLRREITRLVNSRPDGITIRDVASELNMLDDIRTRKPGPFERDDEFEYPFDATPSAVGRIASRLCRDGDISCLGPIGDHFGNTVLSSILMPRLTGLPPIDRTEYEVFA